MSHFNGKQSFILISFNISLFSFNLTYNLVTFECVTLDGGKKIRNVDDNINVDQMYWQ